MKIKAILHDWDDTIVNSYQTYKNWYYEFATTYNLSTPDEMNIRGNWGKKVSSIINSLWPYLSQEDCQKLVSEFKPQMEYIPSPFVGAVNTLNKLKSQNYVLGIISSGDGTSIISSYHKHFGKNNYIHDLMYFEENSKYHKPDNRAFDLPIFELKNKHHIDESETLYIGDSIYDYQAAKHRKMKFVAVLTGLTSNKDFINAGMESKSIINSINDVFEIL